MKKRLASIGLVLLVSLLMAVPVLAWVSFSGQLVDANNDPWMWGATVYAYECTTGAWYGTVTMAPGTNSFVFPLDGTAPGAEATPANLDDVCYYIVYNDPPENPGGDDWAAPAPASGQFKQNPIPADYSLGVISTETGPNAVTLTNITARSANTWLPVGLVAGLSVLALGALFVLRRRRALS